MTPSRQSGAGIMIWNRRRFMFLLSIGLFVRSARAEESLVEIRQFKFQPADITVAAGGTVTFVNLDVVPHTATAESFDTGALKNGERKEVAFPNAGEFPYLCKFHRHMIGRVIVR